MDFFIYIINRIGMIVNSHVDHEFSKGRGSRVLLMSLPKKTAGEYTGFYVGRLRFREVNVVETGGEQL